MGDILDSLKYSNICLCVLYRVPAKKKKKKKSDEIK